MKTSITEGHDKIKNTHDCENAKGNQHKLYTTEETMTNSGDPIQAEHFVGGGAGGSTQQTRQIIESGETGLLGRIMQFINTLNK